MLTKLYIGFSGCRADIENLNPGAMAMVEQSQFASGDPVVVVGVALT
jgi:hypothetical protein